MKSNHKKYKKTVGKRLYEGFEKKKNKAGGEDKESRLEALSSGLNLPTDILAGATVVTIMGSSQLRLENYKGILEYTGDLIRIQGKYNRVHVEGKNLNIDYFTDDEMKVSGRITMVKYLPG